MFKTPIKECSNASVFPTLFAPPEVSTVESGRDSSYSKSETLPVKICSLDFIPTPIVYAVGDSKVQKELVESTNEILARLDNSVEDTTCMENGKIHMTCNGDQNRHASHLQSVSKCDVEDLASSLVKREYDPDESIDSNDFIDELSDYNVHIGSRELDYLGNECIQPEMVKSEQLDSTNNPMSKIVKTEDIFKEKSDNIMIKKEIEFMEVSENRNIVVQRLFNERMIWNDHKGIGDFNLGNECIKKEMIKYEQIDSTGNQTTRIVENEIDVEEVCDNIIIKKEIEFVDVHEDRHIVDQCLYNEKKIYNHNQAVIDTKIAKTNAQRQKEYRMRKKIQKQLLCPKKTPKTNAQRQQEYRENRKKMQLSEELDIIRKKMNAERAKRYRDKLKLKKRQSELDSLLSSKEGFLPT